MTLLAGLTFFDVDIKVLPDLSFDVVLGQAWWRICRSTLDLDQNLVSCKDPVRIPGSLKTLFSTSPALNASSLETYLVCLIWVTSFFLCSAYNTK